VNLEDDPAVRVGALYLLKDWLPFIKVASELMSNRKSASKEHAPFIRVITDDEPFSFIIDKALHELERFELDTSVSALDAFNEYSRRVKQRKDGAVYRLA
jgi:hypothetical protein